MTLNYIALMVICQEKGPVTNSGYLNLGKESTDHYFLQIYNAPRAATLEAEKKSETVS